MAPGAAGRAGGRVRFAGRRIQTVPLVLAVAYVVLVLGVAVNRWADPLGDATDVIFPAMVAIPWGLIALIYPGDRQGAQIVVVLAVLANGLSVYLLVDTIRDWIRNG